MNSSEDEWRAQLSDDQHLVLREHGTERAGSNLLNAEKRAGVYRCGRELFDSDAKYESGSGWPSFCAPREGAVSASRDKSHFMERTEVHCAECKGHVFTDGPQPTGLLYCMNGCVLNFEPEKK